jgi:hypothetical protein
MGNAPLERIGLMLRLLLLPLLLAVLHSSEPSPEVIVLVGAPGEKEYGDDFAETAAQWKEAAAKAHRVFHEISASTGTNQLTDFTKLLERVDHSGASELWLVFVGHGTFDGKEARFNLSGPDLSTDLIASLVQPFTRPLVLVNSASASAPFLNKLSGTNRTIVTATRSGWEENYTRFGRYFAKSLVDPSSDLDKDGQVSVLESFLSATHQVAEFYKNEKRLATEHALLDDNGDKKGTPASFYHGIRPAKKADDGTAVDGFRAHQVHFVRSPDEEKLTPELRTKRNELEAELEKLRARRDQMPEKDYLAELEKVLLQISHIYQESAAKDSSQTK